MIFIRNFGKLCALLILLIVLIPGIASAQSSYIWLEAESGFVNPPIERADDGLASGGKYIWVPNGVGASRIDEPGPSTEYAQYNITTSNPGTYVIWGRVIAPTSADDSFWFSMNNGLFYKWWTPISDEWVWGRVRASDLNQEITFILNAGDNILKVVRRENGTKLDKILITNDMGFVPTGEGGDNTPPPVNVPVEVKFDWTFEVDDEVDAILAGFRLYDSHVSGSYTYGEGHALTVITDKTKRAIGPIFMSLPVGQPHYFVLTAYSTTGLESDPSNEVYTTPEEPTDLPPQGEIILRLESVPSNQ
jgi:hypothetical protein